MKKLMKPMTPRYSGEYSREFWRRVSATQDMTLNLMGCLLQEAEYRMLQALRILEEDGRKPPVRISHERRR